MKFGGIIISMQRVFSIRWKILIGYFFILLTTIISIISFYRINTYRQQLSQYRMQCINSLDNIGITIDYFLGDVINMSLFCFQDKSIYNYLKAKDVSDINYSYYEASSVMSHLANTKNFIYSIYLERIDGESINTIGPELSLTDSEKNMANFLAGMYFWSENDVSYYYGQPMNMISLVRLIRDINDANNSIGYLKINVSVDYILRYLDYLNTYDSWILSNNNQIVASYRWNTFDEDDDGFILEYKFSNVPYVLSVNFTTPDFSGDLVFNSELFLLILFITGFSIFVCFIVSWTMIKELNILRMMMTSVKNENFDVRIEPIGNDEVSLVVCTFNSMIERIHYLIIDNYKKEIMQREAEIKMLRYQMDPHFVYNILNMIYWVAKSEKAEESCMLINAYSKILKHSLSKSSSGFVKIRDELFIVENYVTIMQKRFCDSLKFVIDVDETLLDFLIIELSLQPLIENAIEHGIEKIGGEGTISISIFSDNENICIDISDSACLMDVENMTRMLHQDSSSRKGYAIKNLNDRIKLMFGYDYGLLFYNKDGFSHSIMKFPKKQEV